MQREIVSFATCSIDWSVRSETALQEVHLRLNPLGFEASRPRLRREAARCIDGVVATVQHVILIAATVHATRLTLVR